jgi:hypothetical protein
VQWRTSIHRCADRDVCTAQMLLESSVRSLLLLWCLLRTSSVLAGHQLPVAGDPQMR